MTKARLGLLVAVVVIAAFGAATASASSAPRVFQYQKTCDELTGYCEGTLGNVTIKMWVTGFRATGQAAQMTTTERITVGNDTDFTAELSGHVSPAGFIVLNGTVTGGSFAGARIHQRSNFAGLVNGDPTRTAWTGELQLAPASA